jgi:hypothetical protein
MNKIDDLVSREAAKRDRMWSPAQRWKAMQEFITWADQQQPIRRNTPAACKNHERMIIAAAKNTRPT